MSELFTFAPKQRPIPLLGPTIITSSDIGVECLLTRIAEQGRGVTEEKYCELLQWFINLASSASAAENVTDESSIYRGKTIFIEDLGDPRLSLIRSLPISVEYSSGHVSAYSYDLDEFAIGKNEFDAMNEIRASIVDFYFLLKDEQDNLGPLTQKQWHFLRQIVREA